jgi:hypothetical protein
MTDDRVYLCKICGRTWDVIPDHAERFITHRRGGRIGNLYRFEDSSVHLLIKVALLAPEEQSNVISH